MKKITVLCLCSLTGCAYLHDRVRDTCDVVTVAAETSYANVSIQIGKETIGLGLAEGKGLGLRSGALGVYDYAEANLILFGGKLLIPSERDILRGKGYDYRCEWYPWRPKKEEHEVEMAEGGKFNSWQIEIAAGLGLGGRVGINFAELADLILGLLTIDFLEDDLATIEKQEQEEFQKRKTDNKEIQLTN